MDGRQKPDSRPENKNDRNDDEIIDLTHVLKDDGNDDIINLTEVLEQPDPSEAPATDMAAEAAIPSEDAPSADEPSGVSQDDEEDVIDLAGMELPDETAAEEEEEIIDLMDVATTLESEISATDNEDALAVADKATEPEEDGGESIDLLDVAAVDESDTGSSDAPATDGDEEEIIDLMEVATPVEPQAAPTDGEAAEEEEIIELTDVTAAANDEPVEPESSTAKQEPAQEAGEGDEIIELTEVAAEEEAQTRNEDTDEQQPVLEETDPPEDDDFADLESRADAILADSVEPLDAHTPDEAAETAGPEADFDLHAMESIAEGTKAPQAGGEEMFAPATPVVAESPALTEEQIEDALTRVIEKVYGEKIEQLMLQTIEKTIKREIEKIKSALLENGEGFGG